MSCLSAVHSECIGILADKIGGIMRILYVTTVGSTMNFFRGLIQNLQEKGHSVDLAANESLRPVPGVYRDCGCNVSSISCTRNPFSIGSLKAIGQIRRMVREKQYDIVHCHTPVAAMCTRLACIGARKRGTKVYYTAHGFHFFKGAPLKNWLMYYPVEKICSYFTDVLITINKEDYALAQRKMKAKRVEYVPGVGLDVQKFWDISVDKAQKRQELGIPEDAVLLLSVGELNENKNHQVIIRALAQLDNPNVHYAIAGRGPKREELKDLAREQGLERRVHLLGYREDVGELYKCADIFCHPSRREGLPVSIIEAMSCGMPVICTDIRGSADLIEDREQRFHADDVNTFAKGIERLISDSHKRAYIGKKNSVSAWKYDLSKVIPAMFAVYGLPEECEG